MDDGSLCFVRPYVTEIMFAEAIDRIQRQELSGLGDGGNVILHVVLSAPNVET